MGVGQFQVVTDASGQEKAMHTGGPFPMVAREQGRLQPLLESKTGVGRPRIIVRGGIAGVCFGVDGLEVKAGGGTELLFDLQRKGRLFQIVVGALAAVRKVIRFQRITERPGQAGDGARLRPGSAAQVFGGGYLASRDRAQRAACTPAGTGRGRAIRHRLVPANCRGDTR